jgi:hypothetical protein
MELMFKLFPFDLNAENQKVTPWYKNNTIHRRVNAGNEPISINFSLYALFMVYI